MSTITITLDRNLKEKASALFDELGLGMSEAINLFLEKAVEESKMPFPLMGNMEMRDAIIDALEERNLDGPYRTMEELRAALDE